MRIECSEHSSDLHHHSCSSSSNSSSGNAHNSIRFTCLNIYTACKAQQNKIIKQRKKKNMEKSETKQIENSSHFTLSNPNIVRAILFAHNAASAASDTHTIQKCVRLMELCCMFCVSIACQSENVANFIDGGVHASHCTHTHTHTFISRRSILVGRKWREQRMAARTQNE